MTPAHKLTQPAVGHLGRAGLLFLGSLAIGHGQSVPVEQPPGSTPPVTQDPAQQPTATEPARNPPAARPAEVPSATPTKSAGENALLPEVHRFARRGVEMARVARERARRSEVRQFAERLLADHHEMAEELGAIAEKREVRLRSAAMAERELKQLQQARGTAFDEAFLGFVIADHEDLLELLSGDADTSSDADVARFAEGQVKRIRRHLDDAKQLQNSSRRT